MDEFEEGFRRQGRNDAPAGTNSDEKEFEAPLSCPEGLCPQTQTRGFGGNHSPRRGSGAAPLCLFCLSCLFCLFRGADDKGRGPLQDSALFSIGRGKISG